MRWVFTPGGFDFRNRGDAALVLSFHRLLKRRWPDSQFTMTSFHPQADAEHFDAQVLPMIVRPGALWQQLMAVAARRIPGFAAVQSVLHFVTFALVNGYLPLWAKLYRREPRLARALAWPALRVNAQAVADADAVVLVPGGFMNAYRWTNTFWLYHTPVIFLAAAMGKPASLGPCTIGPFEGPSRQVASRVLHKLDRIVLREQLSVEMLRSLGITDRVSVCPDVAFQYAEDGLDQPRPAASNRLGVSVREYNFPGAPSAKAAQAAYLDAVAGAVTRVLATDPDAAVTVFAQTNEDVVVSRRLGELIASDRVDLQLAEASPDSLVDAYRGLRLMLGTRMHANILAMCSGTPVLAIGYDPKTLGVMRSLGLEKWVVAIDDLDGLADQLIARWATSPTEPPLVTERVAAAVAGLQSMSALLLPDADPGEA